MWHLLSCHCGSLCGCLHTADIPSVLLLCGWGHFLAGLCGLPLSPHMLRSLARIGCGHAGTSCFIADQPSEMDGLLVHLCSLMRARCLKQAVAVECVCLRAPYVGLRFCCTQLGDVDLLIQGLL